MDKVTRGYLEKVLDDYLNEIEIISELDWIRQEVPISSLKDVALGFTLGSLEMLSESVCILKKPKTTPKDDEKDEKEILEMIKRRIPEIVRKINKELDF